MKAIINAVSPQGYKVGFYVEAASGLASLLSILADVQNALLDVGYSPDGELPRTPEGLPICPRHHVPMREREKQGDRWYSHRVILESGHELWCKGRAGDDSPGWNN
jgi:hypothetical protein